MKTRLIIALLAIAIWPTVATSAQSVAEKSYFKIALNDDGIPDTLWIEKVGIEYQVVWQGDTLLECWSYSEANSVVSTLGFLDLMNTFLIKCHNGDGCPFLYQILAIKSDGTYFLSDSFGNCNDIMRITADWPNLAFEFPATFEFGRKPKKIIYNAELFEIGMGKQ